MSFERRLLAEVDVGLSRPVSLWVEVEGGRAWLGAARNNTETSFERLFYENQWMRMESDPRSGWPRFFRMTVDEVSRDLLSSIIPLMQTTDKMAASLSEALTNAVPYLEAAIVMDS